jgi:hypothetical protein
MGVGGGVSQRHEVFRTAKVLRLKYGKLKRMAESVGPMGCSATAPTSFVEAFAERWQAGMD